MSTTCECGVTLEQPGPAARCQECDVAACPSCVVHEGTVTYCRCGARAIVWPEEGSMPESMGRKFRRLLKDEPYLFTGGVYEPLGAQIAERVGMKSIYLSGYSMALHNAWPDMGFLTQTEVARIAS